MHGGEPVSDGLFRPLYNQAGDVWSGKYHLATGVELGGVCGVNCISYSETAKLTLYGDVY